MSLAFLVFAKKRLFLVVAGFRAIAVRRRPGVFLIDDLRRVFRRSLVLASSAPLPESANGNEGHYRHHHNLSYELHHFRQGLLMPSAHWREKESRRHQRLQDKCHKRNPQEARFFAEILPAGPKFRTVSSFVAPYRASWLTLNGDAEGPDISAAVERS